MRHHPGARTWTPSLGAWPGPDGIHFRVWAPDRTSVELVLTSQNAPSVRTVLSPAADGMFTGVVSGAVPGTRYQYLLDGDGPYPDPASRFQPEGVHGPSAIVDPRVFRWSDEGWRGIPLSATILYELHVGTFTPEGTFAAAAERLSYLSALGVTAVELMPIADFPGTRNWGYDGVSLFAPARCYGTPDDLRHLVDEAHRLGLAVLLDVVYNHFGPDGAYAATFSSRYFSTRHASPWGPAMNLDGAGHGPVREFLVENALHWLHEYHFDGLRLDATHALADESPRHILRDLTLAVRGSLPDRQVLLVAEDDRNLATIVKAPAEGGWGLDAVWADDFHHQVRRLSAGDRDGYFQDFSGSAADLAATIRRGWFYCGQHSAYRDAPRGTPPTGVAVERMVVCLQNHDQIGNRAFGERLNHQIAASQFRALSALLLFVPETPLIFMGQEWAASTPFLYFTDHRPDLGLLVTEGRRAEFSRFTAFADESVRSRIPDPQAPSTFETSRLRWQERDRAPHAGVLRLYHALLRLRRDDPAMQRPDGFEALALDDATLAVTRSAAGGSLLLVARLHGAGAVGTSSIAIGPESRWAVVLTTDDEVFVEDRDRETSRPPEIAFERGTPILTFHRPGAVILRMT